MTARKGCCVGAGGTSALATLGALLLPKCPLCVAALLSAVGVSVSVAYEIAPYVRIVGFAVGTFAALGLVILAVGRRARVENAR